MTNRNDLVATPVTDKNGVVTTRWKRPVSPSTGTASLPAPPVPSDPIERTSKDDGSTDNPPFDIETGLFALLEKEKSPERIREMFRTELHPDTLGILDQHYADNYLPILEFVQRCIKEESVASLNNAALFVHLREACWDGRPEDRDRMFEQFIFGLQWHHGVNELDFGTVENGKQIGEALLKAAIGLGRPYAQFYTNRGAGSYYLPSPHLVKLISERPQDIDAIVDLLDSRRLSVLFEENVEAIKELLDGTGAKSLGSGVL